MHGETVKFKSRYFKNTSVNKTLRHYRTQICYGQNAFSSKHGRQDMIINTLT